MTQGFVVGHTDADPGSVKGRAELGADHGDFVISSLPHMGGAGTLIIRVLHEKKGREDGN
jgi:hypothetical protein